MTDFLTEQKSLAYRRLTISIVAEGFILKAGDDDKIKITWDGKMYSKAVAPSNDSASIDVFGIAGLLKLQHSTYLLVITSRRRIGELFGKSIYSISALAALPLNHDQAVVVFEELTAQELESDEESEDDSDTSEDTPAKSIKAEGSPPTLPPRPRPSVPKRTMSLDVGGGRQVSFDMSKNTDRGDIDFSTLDAPPAYDEHNQDTHHQIEISASMSKASALAATTAAIQDVASTLPMTRRSKHRTASSTSKRKSIDNSASPAPASGLFGSVPSLGPAGAQTSADKEGKATVADWAMGYGRFASSNLTAEHSIRRSKFWKEQRNQPRKSPLTIMQDIEASEKRIVKEAIRIFTRGFYFSYEFDMTRTIQEQCINSTSEPYYKGASSQFFWNQNLMQAFIDEDFGSWILPLVQGFVEIDKCSLEGQDFDLALISRRSKGRAGLRYQRRGVNAKGDAANFVETEQILAMTRNEKLHVCSFVQIRGSIPLFWTQSPYNMKPIPILEKSPKENKEAFEKHFVSLTSRYGKVDAICLVEQSGKEGVVGSAYKDAMTQLPADVSSRVEFIPFDFHAECKGMHYENISKLVDRLDPEFHKLQYFWIGTRGESNIYCTQSGVFRTNCMDCLDRTNVVQSALARLVLNLQLTRLGIATAPEKGLNGVGPLERAFNYLWSNNGDAISRLYAGSAALKGDFTRTGERRLKGMAQDAANSVVRLYQNSVEDFFKQGVIDYLLGNYDEANLKDNMEYGSAFTAAANAAASAATEWFQGLRPKK